MWQQLVPRILVAAVFFGLLAACTPQAPPAAAPKPADTAAPKAAPATAPSAQASPAAATTQAGPVAKAPASPAAGTTASPAAAPKAAARVEPKGKVTLALHFALLPRWLDPQEYLALSDYIIFSAVHDAVVKPMPGNPMAPQLAESYEIAPDFMSATFKLRPNVKFHNGDPVTAEDVKFTYENYKGTNAKALKDRTASIETPDARTVKFTFKEPFLDFLDLYGTYASAAGWVVPAKYYQQVGPDGFKQKPIGAGPYKFVSQVAGESMELEAFADYWRKTPGIKTVVAKGLPENATRLAALQVGEIDAATGMLPLQAEQIKADPKLQLAPVQSTNYNIEFIGREKPASPLADKRVRQAISLSLDRKALVTFHTGGLGEIPGNWITRDYPGALDLPPPEEDRAKAKQLLAEAGYPDGFDAGALTPLPPNYPLGEVIQGQLREVGIRTRINQMERAAFNTKLSEGAAAFPEGLLFGGQGTGATAGNQIRQAATCKGSTSRTCLPEIETRFERFEKSINPREREQLLQEIQQFMTDNYIIVPFLRNVFVNAQGPRIANKGEEIWGSSVQYLYIGPWEDVRLKE